MTIWHVLLYAAAALLALRSFVQLATNYRHEYEQIAVSEQLTKLKEEIEAGVAAETTETVDEPVAANS